MTTRPEVIVIGAGFTGCAIAHDLLLRGIGATVIDRGEIASGTSGRTHGLLHSGGRYCVNDREAAIECIDENIILRKIAKQCIEFNQGFFIALNDNDLEYAPQFEKGAQECHIPIDKIPPQKALEMEPAMNPNLLAAYLVPDGTFDPLRLALAFAAHAKKNGAKFFTYYEAEGLILDGKGNVCGVKIWDRTTDRHIEMKADLVINATGAWAGKITEFAGLDVPITPTPGIMVAYDQRLINRVVNRLCPPDDGDILLPQRRMVVIGTTSFEVEDVDYIPVFEDQVQMMRERAIELVPSVQRTHMRGAYMAARPLVGKAQSGRSLARTFKCFDHQDLHGVGGFVTITGGKATTCRIMAEKTVDVVCAKLNISAECQTKDIPLIPYYEYYSR